MKSQEETVVIIDYGMGNLRSVANAILKLNRQNELQGQCQDTPVSHVNSAKTDSPISPGSRVLITRDVQAILKADKIILPGVGAFGECMHNLKKYDLADPIYRVIEQGKPFLGICVGLQLLFEGSEEDPGVAGLGVFTGMVKKIAAPGLKIPHIGWNSLEFKQNSKNSQDNQDNKNNNGSHDNQDNQDNQDSNNGQLFQGVETGAYVYFVHSFYPVPKDGGIVTAVSFYGEVITAAVCRQNVMAVQFHPEKSGSVGLKILANFLSGKTSLPTR